MKVIFIDADERLIAFHTPDTAPALVAYAGNDATERHVVQDEAVMQVGVAVGPDDPDEPPTIRVVNVLTENWRDLIVVPAESEDA